jgi:hypothetical protein
MLIKIGKFFVVGDDSVFGACVTDVRVPQAKRMDL